MIILLKIICIMHGCLIVIVIATNVIFYLCIHSTHFGVINSYSLSPISYHYRVIVISYALLIAFITVILAFILTYAFILLFVITDLVTKESQNWHDCDLTLFYYISFKAFRFDLSFRILLSIFFLSIRYIDRSF